MRISDWSSDVCSSDLDGATHLERLRQFEGNSLTDSILRVQRGVVDSNVAPAGQGVGRFEVRTPVAVTGVRGTRFRVQAGAQGARSEVIEGSVRLQPHARDSAPGRPVAVSRSEEHTSELQSLMRISSAVFCL